MSRKVFTAGEVLAASDVNQFLMDQSVMSFPGTAARGSAIPSPVEGMVTYLNDVNALSVYNGTEWTIDRTIQVFSDSTARGSAIATPIDGMAAYLQDSNTLAIYDGVDWVAVGESKLQLIATTSFSAVASEQLDDVFSASYENYIIIVNLTTGSISGADVNLRTATGGTPASGAGTYEWGQFFVGAASSVTAGSSESTADTKVRIGRIDTSGGGLGAKIVIYNPFSATRTKLHALASGFSLQITGAAWTVTTSYDGVQILASSGTMTGTMTVYGIKES